MKIYVWQRLLLLQQQRRIQYSKRNRKMQFTNINLFKNGNNAVKAAFGYAENHEGDLKKGSLMMTSQFTQILKNPRPFVIIFDEFGNKNEPRPDVLRIRITNENICMATLVAVTATTTNTIFKTK